MSVNAVNGDSSRHGKEPVNVDYKSIIDKLAKKKKTKKLTILFY